MQRAASRLTERSNKRAQKRLTEEAARPHSTLDDILDRMWRNLRPMLPFGSATTTHTSSKPLAPLVIGCVCPLRRLCHPQQTRRAERDVPPACGSQTSCMAGGRRQGIPGGLSSPGAFTLEGVRGGKELCSSWGGSSVFLHFLLPFSASSLCFLHWVKSTLPLKGNTPFGSVPLFLDTAASFHFIL